MAVHNRSRRIVRCIMGRFNLSRPARLGKARCLSAGCPLSRIRVGRGVPRAGRSMFSSYAYRLTRFQVWLADDPPAVAAKLVGWTSMEA
jgi:hypothetical protein